MNIFDRLAARLGYRRARLPGDLPNRIHLFSAYSDEIPAPDDDSPRYHTHARVYAGQVWVHRCVQLVAQSLASVPLRIYDAGGQEVLNHPLAALIRYANPGMSRRDLWEATVQDMLLGGENFWELVPDARGRPVEIWPRRPDRVLVVPGGDVADRRYHRVARYRIRDETEAHYDVPPQYIVHFRFRNPLNAWRGLAPLAAVRMGVLIDLYASIWSRSFFRNSARPDGVLESSQALTATERERLRSEVAMMFKGPGQAHRLAILEEGQTYKPLSWPPRDLEWVAQRKLSREEICAVFGVPLPLAGDLEHATYENIEQARRIFWADTITPLADYLAATIAELMSTMLAPGCVPRFDLSQVAALQRDYGDKVASIHTLWTLGTPANQAIALLLPELGPIPGGDVSYVPFAVVPAGPALAARAAPIPARRAVAPGIGYGSALHKSLWRAFVSLTQPREDAMQRQLRADFDEQHQQVIDALRQRVKSWAAEEMFDLALWIERFREQYERYFADVLLAAGEAAFEYLDIDVAWTLRNPWVQQWLETYVFQFAQRVNATTVADLRRELLAAEAAGEGIADILQRVANVFDARANQAEFIARTEINRAANAGTLRAYEESPGVEYKQWLGSLDDRIRESHELAHGQTVPLAADFDVGGAYLNAPGDPKAPPEETVNCRCTIVPILRGELL